MARRRAPFPLIKLRDGTVLAMGGYDENGSIGAAELYDPATNAWTGVPPMGIPRHRFAATLLADGRVLVAGGGSTGSNSATVEVFNPASRQWTTATGSLASPSYDLSVAALPDGRALIAGGANGDALSQAAIWSPGPGNGGTVTATTSMGAARTGFDLAVLASGKVLAAGGATSASAEVFDPARGTWAPTLPMLAAHVLSTSTRLANGKVLVAGGDPSVPTELYDPSTGSWSGDAATVRSYHSATLLADGRVLVAGGKGTATAELWTPTTSLVADASATFGDARTGTSGTAVVQVTNTGDSTLFTGDFAIGGAHPADFAVDASRCRTVAPAATCLLGVTFAPTAAGARSATLTFSANTAGGTYAVLLSGHGNADADGDGVADSADRCKTLKGAASRQGCPAGMLADPSIRYRPSGKGIRVLAYYVKATKGAKLTVKCSRGCRKTVTKGKGAKRVRITKLTGRRLANGAKITITVSLKGRLTTTVTDRISKARRIEGRPKCAPVGC